MPALTEFLDKPIRDPNGEAVAALRDLVVRLPQTDTPAHAMDVYPPVIGLVARVKGPRGSRDIFIPWDEVKSLTPEGAELATQQMNLRRFQRREGEIVLRDGLFDRQVVDLEGRRVVRINDLDLARRDDWWRLVAVDISPSALLRRMGWARVGQAVSAAFGHDFARKAPLIDWSQVAPVANDGEGALRLRVPRARLEVMRPADLARLVEQLTPQQGAIFLDDLDDAHAADTLEELEDEQQGQILRAMDPERAADLLQEMEPDEATDALQSITTEEAEDLLKRMDREEASEVQELLGWPEDSAGGIMTTDYISVPDWATVEEVIAALRARAKAAIAELDDPLPEGLMELFIVSGDLPAPIRANVPKSRTRGRSAPRTGPTATAARPGASLEAEGKLVGKVSLRDLLLADPSARVVDIAHPVSHVAHPLDNEREVAHAIADDDLLALPVVDDQGALLGIVTVDDAIDVILPTAWKKRIPRLFH
ncbi:MAG TPA: CBS domain-containing protein [Ktedonobacterales bacterium]|nr:CBS domain-containing protein [Ktedonobacterales bacterium]